MKPLIGITAGCPCGVGPEVVAKAAVDPRVLQICSPRIFGRIDGPVPHEPKECGGLSIKWLDEAIHAAMTGEISAIVTGPIDKSHWHEAGSTFAGHTDYLAHVTASHPVAMMMVSPDLKIGLVTTHVPISAVPQIITVQRICDITKLVAGYPFSKSKKIAICALNPHSGELGLMGIEEDAIIKPAIELLQKEGLDVSGPYPADTVFWRARHGEFGAVVAMYHDQALAAIKTLDFKNTVNVTMGLPFVRTSPDHGTASDIAGKGIADHENTVRAVELAVKLVNKK